MRKQTGFTLVEIAIVLVIIGLLLGGVLKGQELVINAQAKSIANDLKNVQTLIYGYQDRFRALPGDDVAVVNHLGANAVRASTPAPTLGNGAINGAWNTGTTTDESYLFWQHVRLAGFATGSATVGAATYFPQNSQGGIVGVTGVTPINTMAGTYFVCANNINGRLALIVDANLDDGVSTTGSVRIRGNQATGAGGGAAGAIANVVPATMYTVCMSF